MTINEEQLMQARLAWGNGMIAISRAYKELDITEAKIIANDFLDNVYGFELGPVLFKPTLSGGAQTFRPTKGGALSYFVGHDPAYPSDSGFGIKSCAFDIVFTDGTEVATQLHMKAFHEFAGPCK